MLEGLEAMGEKKVSIVGRMQFSLLTGSWDRPPWKGNI